MDSSRRGGRQGHACERAAELLGLDARMNAAMDEICTDYAESDLQVLAPPDGGRVSLADAVRGATEKLAGD